MMEPLWTPSQSRVEQSNMRALCDTLGCAGYPALHALSVKSPERFWRQVWLDTGVIGDAGDDVLVKGSSMPEARWFPQARLNFAENLLRYRDERTAIVAYREDGTREAISYRDLFQRSVGLARWLQERGIVAGDRVAAFMPNTIETVVAMLGAASIGATFSSCSPDFGIQGVLDRFGQIKPRVLICADGYSYGGKRIEVASKGRQIAATVSSIEQVLICRYQDEPQSAHVWNVPLTDFTAAQVAGDPDFDFERFSFDHPLYALYSSGTTGMPKCIVHGAGGTLLQHLKEHRYHVDLGRDDMLFYYTTCGWMMWNWLVSGLSSGVTLLLYDGSPFHPSATHLIGLIESEGITVFGTSAKYIASLEKAGVHPRRDFELGTLRTVLSTGSPLSHESFRYVYRELGEDLCLSSISGGTDIVSCFVLGNPLLPVYEGEIQCAGLGMDVHVFNESGEAVAGEKGELVCTTPFPSMPIGFWNDQDGERYSKAYFARFPGVWAHGDYGEVTANGGMIIHGRSDAVLNPGGVRIGTAEIYRQVEKIAGVVDAVCIGQQWQDDVRVVLFVVLAEGVSLDSSLIDEIRTTIRQNATPRHVPAKVLAVPQIPRTISGKVVELAVRNVVHGDPVENTDALANPGALAAFANRAELGED